MAGISEEDQGSEDAEAKYRAEEKAVITSSTQESRKESTIVQEEEFVKSKQEFIESKQEYIEEQVVKSKQEHIEEQVVESKQEYHQESKKESIVMHQEFSQKKSIVQEDIESMVVESSTTQSSTRKESVQQMETLSSQEQTTDLLAERLDGMTLTQDSTVQVIYIIYMYIYFCISVLFYSHI